MPIITTGTDSMYPKKIKDKALSAVSHQLRRLRDLSIVKRRREGQILYYSLDDDHVVDLLKIGLEHVRD